MRIKKIEGALVRRYYGEHGAITNDLSIKFHRRKDPNDE
jgi:hypothetical protein